MSPRRARRRFHLHLGALLLLGQLPAAPLLAQPDPGEYGDAPEGGPAYPPLGVLGNFPTCIDIGGYYVSHGPVQLAWFGTGVDYEPNGNGGPCHFPPPEQDECWGPTDLDAGLLGVSPFSIDPTGTQILPCGGLPIHPLGNPCQIVSWGPTMDIVVNNFSGMDCAVNVLVDWNHDGRWYGQSVCPGGGVAEEHAVQNLPVPDGYAGTLAGLGASALQLGPDPGYVWVRFSIASLSEAVPIGWTGAQQFDFGESEDYLLLVGDPAPAGELGDAPEEVVAYPDNGSLGHFPTCLSGPNGYVLHAGNAGAWLGAAVDLEGDGNATLCSFAVYDNDECGAGGGDAGLLLADPFTIDAGQNIVPCAAGEETPLGAPCAPLVWGVDIDLWIENGTAATRWVNALFDWDNNGRWGDWVTCTDGTTGNEHALQDFPIPGGYSGPLSALGPADFSILRGSGWVWSRFTLSDAPVAVVGWDGQGTFGDGETEDYLLRISGGTAAPPMGTAPGRLHLEPCVPNPFNPSTQIAFTLREAGLVRLTIHDIAGRCLATLLERRLEAGRQTLAWAGREESGRVLGSGVYFVRVAAGGEVAQGKLMLVK